MKKADLQNELDRRGLSTKGTAKELKARLAGDGEPLVTSAKKSKVSVKVGESKARRAYRMGSHIPKGRKNK